MFSVRGEGRIPQNEGPKISSHRQPKSNVASTIKNVQIAPQKNDNSTKTFKNNITDQSARSSTSTSPQHHSFIKAAKTNAYDKSTEILGIRRQRAGAVDATIELFKLIKSDPKSAKTKEKMQEYISKGGNVNAKDNEGRPLLHFAIINGGGSDLVKFLIEEGADPNIKDNYNHTPLMFACAENDVESVKFLLTQIDKNGINDENKVKQTALMLAAYNNNFEIVKLLLENGADVNRKDTENMTALQWGLENNEAIESGDNEKITNILNEAIEKEREKEMATSSLLDLVKNNPKVDLEQAKELLKHANPNAKDEDGNPLLHFAILKGPEIVKLLVEKGADPNLADHDNITPLRLAITWDNPEIVMALVGNKKEILTQALFDAVFAGKVNIVKWLVEDKNKKLDVNVLNSDDRSPLMIACEKNNKEMVKLLLENGANVLFENTQEINARAIARATAFRTGDRTIRDLLYEI